MTVMLNSYELIWPTQILINTVESLCLPHYRTLLRIQINLLPSLSRSHGTVGLCG